MIAAGFFPLTNNVASFELLDNSTAIVYHEKPDMLCKAFMEHKAKKESLFRLMDVVASKHTYVSRLSSMLDFFASIPLDDDVISSNVPLTTSNGVNQIEVLIIF